MKAKNNMIKLSVMEKEAREVPELITKQLELNQPKLEALCKRLQQNLPLFAITIGRGSSDNACTYAKYLLETQLGLVTASAAPSVVTVYKANLALKNALVIAISQSGKSPDICKMLEMARETGAVTVAIVNHTDSPLAKAAEFVIPICAGEEKSVAATKSYILSLSALAHFTAIFSKNTQLLLELSKLPKCLCMALSDHRFASALTEFKNINRTFVIARGFGFPIAEEAALKFKETASIQAEAFSAAEIMHGPFTLVKKNHPYLLFAQNDVTLNGILDLSKRIKKLGGKPFLVIPESLIKKEELASLATFIIPLPESLDPILDPIVAIQAFYPMVAKLAVARGFNPDAPENLNKVTETF
ncbi:MAG: SIS domain-containing protein [Gammaproteobacteria bacterium]|nr:SIS domain-containing protein [Gammaproteobacteria bacterium]